MVDHPLRIQHYDPAIPDWADAPEPCEMVACIDVLEHIEPELIGNVLDDLQRVTRSIGLFTMATMPAVKVLEDGRNAHLIVEPSCVVGSADHGAVGHAYVPENGRWFSRAGDGARDSTLGVRDGDNHGRGAGDGGRQLVCACRPHVAHSGVCGVGRSEVQPFAADAADDHAIRFRSMPSMSRCRRGFWKRPDFYLNTSPKKTLAYLPSDTESDYFTGTGTPRFYTIVGDSFRFGTVPDATYTATLTYYTALTSVSAGGSAVNWLLTAHPDAHLYGALLEAAGYLSDDGRVPMWTSALAQVLDSIRSADAFGRMVMRWR